MNKKLSDEDIIEIFNEISDDMAFDSDLGGDSDAEDNLPYVQTVKNKKLRSHTINQTEILNESMPSLSEDLSPVTLGENTSFNFLEGFKPIASTSIEPTQGIEISNSPNYCVQSPSFSISSRTRSSRNTNTLVPEVPNVCSSLDYENEIANEEFDEDFFLEDTNNIQYGNNDYEPLSIFNDHQESEDSDKDELSTKEIEANTNTYPLQFSKIGNQPDKYLSSRYRAKKGPVDPYLYKKSPLDIWELIFLPFIDKIVTESNLYASQKNVSLDTTPEEVRAYLGIVIFMGYHSLPSIRSYWSSDPNFFCERVAKVMTVKRFLKLTRFLHLNDNLQMPLRNSEHFDKLYKIRPLINHLKQVYSDLYTPSKQLAIDESMVAFTGRSTMKQFMPLKPIKRGFKVWALADSSNGYLINFDVYTGKKSSNQTEFGLGENVVLDLTQNLKHKSCCLYFDNFFTSIPLIVKLHKNDLFACGTFRVNKKMYPKDIMKKDKDFKMGDTDFAQSDDVSISRWKDRGKKPVTVVSNMHNASATEIVLRTNSRGQRTPILCPSSIADYNRYMGAVDRFDQYMSAYSVSQKSRRWWVKLFYYMLDTTIVNSFLLYKDSCNAMKKKYMSHLDFRSKLTDQLISDFSSRQRRPTISPMSNKRKNSPGSVQISGKHLAIKISTYRRCVSCSKSKEKRSNMACDTCDKVLCKDCFAKYHE